MMRVLLLCALLCSGGRCVIAQEDGVVLSLDMVLNGEGWSEPLIMKQGQMAEEAASSVAERAGFEGQQAQELVERLTGVLQSRLEELDGTMVPISVDGQERFLHHHESRDLKQETAAFCEFVGIAQDSEAWDNCVGMLADAVTERFNAEEAPTEAESNQEIQGPDSPSSATEERDVLLLSIPVVIDNEEAILNHYQSKAPLETAAAFCEANMGGADEEHAAACVEAVAGTITMELERLTTVDADASGSVASTVLHTIPLNINGIPVDLYITEGETAGQMAEALCSRPELEMNTAELMNGCIPEVMGIASQAIRAHMEALYAETPDVDPSTLAQEDMGRDTEVFTVPVTVGEETMYAVYQAGESPKESASSFCSAHLSQMEAALLAEGVAFTSPEELHAACSGIVGDSIAAVLAGLQRTVEESEAKHYSENVVASIPVSMNGEDQVMLDVMGGDTATMAAEKFIRSYGLSEDFVPDLAARLDDHLSTLSV